ncbi:methyltransferase, FxLD system [Catenuloplanes niger]|uniref:methyltransferase, FxLD system n=2 Tax=Catenuloplanes TaxID=33874 RepID=UPI00286BFBB1|nr:methyltransferase, FxLD system [Catenuloplanes niger]
MQSDSERAYELRTALVDQLVTDGLIVSPAVADAFRTVPRHLFVPADTPLEVVYAIDRSVITKTGENGEHLSSVSATYIQAREIEQAGVTAGMRVLEVGSGGYNAALLAEVVGADGAVVTVDIDPDITARATALLAETGYGDRVRVVQLDAAHVVPGEELFDAIIVTVGVWDVLPAWLSQLTPEGVIVVPLRMNGVTRTIAFRRDGDRLVSTSTEVAGFVPMQGDSARPERILRLPDPQGGVVSLRFDVGVPDDPRLLDGVLATGRSEAWSQVEVAGSESFADLYLWMAGFLPGFCLLHAEEGTTLSAERGWFPFGVVRGDSFAYFAFRPAAGGSGSELGARAYGPHGEEAAAAMAAQIRAWDRHARRGPAPTFAYWPAGSGGPGEASGNVAVLEKTHGVFTISWPAVS